MELTRKIQIKWENHILSCPGQSFQRNVTTLSYVDVHQNVLCHL